MQRFTIEPSSIPGQWMALDNGVPMRTDGKLWLFGSAAAASNWIDEHMPMADVLADQPSPTTDQFFAEMRAARSMRITEGLPTDWNVFRITEDQCRERNMPVECAGWAVTRDHGALVVGVGYVSRDQATYVAWRTLADD